MDKLLQFISLGMKAGAYILGSNSAVSAAKSNKVRLLLLSIDASQNTKKSVNNTADYYDIPVIACYDKITLGRAVGKEQISVIGVKDKNFAQQISKLYGQIRNGGMFDGRI